MALTITTGIMGDVLGDGATEADYERYAELLERAIRTAYPDAEVEVSLGTAQTRCYRDDEPDEDLEFAVRAIGEHVFERGEWAAARA